MYFIYFKKKNTPQSRIIHTPPYVSLPFSKKVQLNYIYRNGDDDDDDHPYINYDSIRKNIPSKQKNHHNHQPLPKAKIEGFFSSLTLPYLNG